jgi:N-acetylneuraminic acid mutarotase
MPTSRRWFGLATYEGKIYAIGGTLGYNANTGNTLLTGANEMYDPATDMWTQKTAMPTARTQLQANAVSGKIYLISGLKSNLPTPSLTDVTEIYDPYTDSWSIGTPIPTAMASYVSAALNGKIYILAGSLDSGQGFGYTNQIYDVATDSWGKGERLPTTTLQSVAVSTGEPNARVYVIGGRLSGPVNATQIYNPATDNWTYGADFPTTHDYITEYLAATSLNGKIYVFGGIAHANEGFFEITEQYSPTSNSPAPSNAGPVFLTWGIPLLLAAGLVVTVLYLKRHKLSSFLGLGKTAN